MTVTKQTPWLSEAKAIIDREYEEGRNTLMSTEELEAIVRRLAPYLEVYNG